MFAFNTMNLSMPIIDDDLELVRILDNMNFDEYELTDMLMEQPDESPHELTGVGMAPTSDTLCTSALEPRNGSSSVLCSGVDLCQGSCLFHSPYAATTKQHLPTMSARTTCLSLCHTAAAIYCDTSLFPMVTATRKVPGRPRCQ